MTPRVASTYYYLERPAPESEALKWFRELEQPPVEIPREHDIVLLFKHLGDIEFDEMGNVDSARSPAVIIDYPKVRRGIFWTVGEVHFLTKRNAPTGRAITKIQKQFQDWLYSFPAILGPSTPSGDDRSYYLEGSIQNYAERLLAFPSALQALQQEQYFVHVDDNDFVLDRICKKLRLRGVICI
jgi:hypothetical protein